MQRFENALDSRRYFVTTTEHLALHRCSSGILPLLVRPLLRTLACKFPTIIAFARCRRTFHHFVPTYALSSILLLSIQQTREAPVLLFSRGLRLIIAYLVVVWPAKLRQLLLPSSLSSMLDKPNLRHLLGLRLARLASTSCPSAKISMQRLLTKRFVLHASSSHISVAANRCLSNPDVL